MSRSETDELGVRGSTGLDREHRAVQTSGCGGSHTQHGPAWFERLRYLMEKDMKNFDNTATKVLLHIDDEPLGINSEAAFRLRESHVLFLMFSSSPFRCADN